MVDLPPTSQITRMRELRRSVNLTRAADFCAVASGALCGVLLSPVGWVGLAAMLGATIAAGLRVVLGGRSWVRDAERLMQQSDSVALAANRDILDSEILAEMPVPYLILDGDAVIQFCSAEANELLSRNPVGRHISGVFRSPAILEAVEAAISEANNGSLEFVARRPREMHLLASIRTLSAGNTADEPRAVLALQDMTPIRQAEATRIDFVAHASHELRTPLAAISGMVETLRGPAKDDHDNHARFLGIIAREAERMTRLVADLLSLSRIESEEGTAPTDHQDLRPILEEACSAMSATADEGRNQIDLDLPETLPRILGDKDDVAQVFINLIENAIKYGGPDQPVRISIADPRRHGAPEIGVTVRDFGDGIDPVHIPRLTERFFRVEKAASKARGGTGLGLAIVKHIMSRHRGELTIESALGEGSRFTAWFQTAAV